MQQTTLNPTRKQARMELALSALELVCGWCGELVLGALDVRLGTDPEIDFQPCCEEGRQAGADCLERLALERAMPDLLHGATAYRPRDVVGGVCLGEILIQKLPGRKVSNGFVDRHHRHLGHTAGDRFRLAALVNGRMVGVAVAGRPVSRALDDGTVIEVNRLVTLENDPAVRNVSSALYGACKREATAMGMRRLITYIREDECGASLRAAGLVPVAHTKGGSWDTPARRRGEPAQGCRKVRYEAVLSPRPVRRGTGGAPQDRL